MFKKRGRPSRREILEANNASDRFYAAMAGKEPKFQNVLKPKRTYRKPGADGRKLEKHVLAEVLTALRRDPRVAFCERQQSGVFKEGNRYIRVGTPGALDIRGLLHGGVLFEIEVKRPGAKPDPRQAERIAALKANGAIAGYATSAEEALALLP